MIGVRAVGGNFDRGLSFLDDPHVHHMGRMPHALQWSPQNTTRCSVILSITPVATESVTFNNGR